MLRALHEFDKRPGNPVPVPPDLAARLSAGPPLDPLVLGMAALVAHERKGFSPTFDLDRLDLARDVAKHEERRISPSGGKGRPRRPSAAAYGGFCLTLERRSLSPAELEAACEAERQHIAPHSL